MPVDPRIQNALNGPGAFERLRALVKQLQADGQDQAAILELFERTRQHFREADQEADEDMVMQVMDCLVGWCSPHMSLEPHKQQ
jgi:hypothetical protein